MADVQLWSRVGLDVKLTWPRQTQGPVQATDTARGRWPSPLGTSATMGRYWVCGVKGKGRASESKSVGSCHDTLDSLWYQCGVQGPSVVPILSSASLPSHCLPFPGVCKIHFEGCHVSAVMLTWTVSYQKSLTACGNSSQPLGVLLSQDVESGLLAGPCQSWGLRSLLHIFFLKLPPRDPKLITRGCYKPHRVWDPLPSSSPRPYHVMNTG